MRDWSTLKKLVWLFGSGAGGLGKVWVTVSGSIVSFVTSVAYPMRKLLAKIEPQQNLHGYDAPWAAGAGKNKVPLTVDGIKSANSQRTWGGNSTTISGITYTILTDANGVVTGVQANGTATANATLYIFGNTTLSYGGYILNGGIAGGSSSTYYIEYYDNTAGQNYRNYSDGDLTLSADTNGHECRLVIAVRNGATVSNIVFKPMIRASGTSATFEPYSNVCPITGWTGLSGVKSNGNLFDPDANPTKFIDASGNIVTNGTTSRTTEPIYINSGITKAWLKSSRAVGAICIASYDKDNHLLLRTAQLGVLSISQNIPSGTAYVRFAKYGTAGEECDLCANFGDTATEGFPAYTGTTITCTWQTEAGTVYGGTVDVVSGVLTVDRAKYTITENDYVGTQNGYFRIVRAISGTKQDVQKTLCTDYPVSASFSATGLYLTANEEHQGTIYFPKDETSRFTDATAFKAYLVSRYQANNPVEIIYPLATPQTYQLTPQQVSTLLGNNTVFVDTGDIEVEYLES